MRFEAVLTVALFLSSLVFVGSAHSDADVCKRAIAKASAELSSALVKAHQKCRDRIASGHFEGPCPDSKTALTIGKAETKLKATLDNKCGGPDRSCGAGVDESLSSIGWNLGVCPGLGGSACTAAIADCNDVADCLICLSEAASIQIIGLYYDDLVSTSVGQLLACQRSVGRAGARFFSKKSKALQKCEDAVLAGTGTPPCPDSKATFSIARAREKAAAQICKFCGGEDQVCQGIAADLTPPAIGFIAQCPPVTVPNAGPSCGHAIDELNDIVGCTSCVTDFEADCLDAASVLTLKPYPAECGISTPTPSDTATPTPTTTTTAATTPTATPTMAETPTATPTTTETLTPTATETTTATPLPVCTPHSSGTYTDNCDGTVTDSATGLQWEKKTNADGGANVADPHDADNVYIWSGTANGGPDGSAFVSFLAALNNAPCFAGHCDWRLPTSGGLPNQGYPSGEPAELESILLAPYPCGGNCIDPIFGPINVGPPYQGRYWSNTIWSQATVWTVSFEYGSIQTDAKNSPTYARAVRVASNVTTPTPALTPTPVCTPHPSGTYTDNCDGTVTDSATGLQWEKKTTNVGSGQNFADAHDVDNTYTWCHDPNNNSSCTAGQSGTAFTDFLVKLNTAPCFAGHCDWRLPSEEGRNSPYTGPRELETILLASCLGAPTPCIDPIFGPTVAYRHWSATYFAAGPGGAWQVSFDVGSVDYDGRWYAHSVRAVRTGP